MCLQQSILNRYRSANPTDTLKEISKKTGIQLTRVFRLMNGSEMKLKEYEAFEQALIQEQRGINTIDFLEKSKNCLLTLPPKTLQLLNIEMNHLLKIHQFKNKPSLEFLDTQLLS